MKICSTIPIFLCGLLMSCGSKEKTESQKPPKTPRTFDKALFDEVTPMADGSAYLTSLDSQLWYLRGKNAMKVTVLDNPSTKIPEFWEITPVLDGTAYAISREGDGLWHLHENYAEKVSEVAFLPQSESHNKIPDKSFFALYVTEHKKRKAAEERADNPPEPLDDSRDYDYDY